MPLTRRRFLTASSALALAPAAGLPAQEAASRPASRGVPDSFPSQPPELVQEIVRVSHFDLAKVRELVGRRPALARAAWDWGFGDWESALGAASHMGNREIAAALIAAGARPDLFTAAMLGQLDVVRSAVAASPGIQTIRGPHGITLLAHARAGGEPALPVLRYLEGLGNADPKPETRPLSDAERAALAGRYRFGSGASELLSVEVEKDRLTVRRGSDGVPRNLFHLGDRAFHPAGAEAVRIRFSAGSPAATVEVWDPDLQLTARREA